MEHSSLVIPKGRSLDCVTLGRANMDLYTEIERSIEETGSFTKSVGGSPANIAAAMARLGMAVGMLTRVADDPVGHFVVRFLNEIGVDTSRVTFDSDGASTSVAFAETRSSGSRTVLYRNNAADLLLSPAEIDQDYLANSSMLLISGQALSVSPSRDAAMVAIERARSAGTMVALDIDYRPYSWKSPEAASVALSLAAERCDLVIGTREEFDALELLYRRGSQSQEGSESRDRESAAYLLERGVRLVVIKRGEEGSLAVDASGHTASGPVYPVKPAKPYGAGDAFAGALLYQLYNGAPLQACLKAAAANASINISRTRCAEDMARWEEIETFLEERNDALSH